jgi:thioredoxin reductase (NADPH)
MSDNNPAPKIWDVIIVGSGPAGYTAAIYTSRARLTTLLLAGETAGGQLMYTREVENYPGFKDGIQGPELMQQMREQAARFEAEIKDENVTRVDLGGQTKKIWVGETEYQAKTVILTVGAKARMLGIGEEKLLGRGLSTCATCDAAFFKDKQTYVVGGGDVAMEDSLTLAKYAKKVTIIHRRDEFKASKIMQDRVKEAGIEILWNSQVTAIKGEAKLEGITVKNVETNQEQELAADGLFLAIGHIPASDFLGDSVEIDDHRYIINRLSRDGVEQRQELLSGYPTMTSIEGVFAAGDVVDFRYRQAVTAAGMGCMAALDVEKFLTGSTASW